VKVSGFSPLGWAAAALRSERSATFRVGETNRARANTFEIVANGFCSAFIKGGCLSTVIGIQI